MNKHLLPAAAVLALVSGSASAGTVNFTTSFFPSAYPQIAAPAGVHGYHGGSVGPYLGASCGVSSCTGGGLGMNIGTALVPVIVPAGPLTVTAPATGTLKVTVTDGYLYGDVYQVFINGTSAGDTSDVTLGPPDGTGGGTYSTGEFDVAVTVGDTVSIDIADILYQYLSSDGSVADPYGGGSALLSDRNNAGLFVVAQETYNVVTTPEPASAALLGVGLLGLGFGIGWRRRSQT